MKNYVLAAALLSFVILPACNRSAGAGPHATVELRDGTSVSGSILSSSAKEIEIVGDDKLTRTIPMGQVRSVEYDDPATQAPAAENAPPAAGSAAPPAAGGAPSAPPRRELSHRDHYHPTEAAVTTKTYELPAGTEISVRNEESIDSGKAAEGQTYPAEVTQDVRDAEGNVVIPRGANAQIVIRSASKGGRIRGTSDLVMDLATVSIDGREYELSTADVSERGHAGVGANKRTGEFAGGGAAIGAIIGAIAGGGKGAAIGAGSGAGAGALTQILTKGTIKVPVETILTFKLDRPLRVRAAS
ncbi:MAG TPA: hypothetical protein VJ732_12360 [Bryobacteraceae bacterium]|nr:hypothetical protein [Bryobacteraceae bacterium]